MRNLAVALLALVACGGALAADGASLAYRCRSRPAFDSDGAVRLATVRATERHRSHFYRDDDSSCPDAPECRREAFVVAGDVVLVDRVERGWACVWFAGAKGSTMGYLAAKDLAFADVDGVPSIDDWVGGWEKVDSVGAEVASPDTVAFSRDGDRLLVLGEALWFDSNDIVSTGEIGAFDASTQQRIPVPVRVDGATATLDADQEYSCGARFHRLGEFLFIDDNDHCGGMNITFDGIYRRAPARKDPTR
jgi:hypothetical protein